MYFHGENATRGIDIPLPTAVSLIRMCVQNVREGFMIYVTRIFQSPGPFPPFPSNNSRLI